MTKKAVLVGLAMAAVVLLVLFVFFRPKDLDAPTDTFNQTSETPGTDQNVQNSESNNSSEDLSQDNDADSLDTELDSLEADINSDNSTDLDINGL